MSLLVTLYVGPTQDRGAAFAALDGPVALARIPVAGELVFVGKDEDGVPADYRVMLVRHLVHTPGPDAIVAEVYARRVSAAAEVAERAPRHSPDAPWRRGAKPRLPRM
jgi:hypothetical protein